MVNISGKMLAGIGIAGFLFLALVTGLIFYVVTSDNGGGDTDWNPDTGEYSGLSHDVVDDGDVSEDTEEFILDVDDENEEVTDPTSGADTVLDTNDDESSTSSSTSSDSSDYPDAPLMRTPTFFKVQSAIPTSQAYWAYEIKTEYPVLEDAKIEVYQDIPEIAVTNYKTSGTTGATGYTSALDLEANTFSSFGGVDGKAYVLLTSEHVASSTGKLGYTVEVPETKNSVKVLKVIPDTYGFSTIMTTTDDGGWFDNVNADNVNIKTLRPVASTSSWGWNLASLTDPLNLGDFDIYLSTKSNGDWRKQTFSTTDSIDSNGEFHVVLRPQILTAEQDYDGTAFDMETTGTGKTFYVKFQSGLTSQVFKVTYDLKTTSIENIKMVKI